MSLAKSLGSALGADLGAGFVFVLAGDLGEPLDDAEKLFPRQGRAKVSHRLLRHGGGEKKEVGGFERDETEILVHLGSDGEIALRVGPLLEAEQLGGFSSAP